MAYTCRQCEPKRSFLAVKQQGDTFPVFMTLRDDGVISQLEEGCNLIVAFYNCYKERICQFSTDKGNVTYSDGIYTLLVGHNASRFMVGKVGVELTITQGDDVHNGDKVVALNFEPRLNNKLVQSGDTPSPEPTPTPTPGVEIATEEEINAITEGWT